MIQRIAVAMTVAATALTAACSSSAGATTASSAPAVTTAPIAQGAAGLLAQSSASVQGAGSVRLRGTLPLGSASISADVRVGATDAIGTVRAGTGQAEVRLVQGRLYVRGDDDFWDAVMSGTGTVLGGRWTEVSATTAAAFHALLTVMPAGRALDRLASGGTPIKVTGPVVDGVATIGLKSKGSAPDTVYVSTRSPYYPLIAEPAAGGKVRFADWTATVLTVKTPPAPVLDATRTVSGG